MPPILLQENAADHKEGWRAKDCAVYLVMAVTVKGRTGEKGATTTNRLVNVGDFFTQQVRLQYATTAVLGQLLAQHVVTIAWSDWQIVAAEELLELGFSNQSVCPTCPAFDCGAHLVMWTLLPAGATRAARPQC